MTQGRYSASKQKKKSTPVKSQRAKTATSKKQHSSDSSFKRTPVTSLSPIEWSPSPSPVKEKRARKKELRRRLKQVQRRLSFSGFDDESIKPKVRSQLEITMSK